MIEAIAICATLGLSYYMIRRARLARAAQQEGAQMRLASSAQVHGKHPARDSALKPRAPVGVMLRSKGAPCPSALLYKDHWWPMDQAPTLPMPDCKKGELCTCVLEQTVDRRSRDRRVSRDRRDVIRFDTHPSRRSGVDRRADANSPFRDVR